MRGILRGALLAAGGVALLLSAGGCETAYFWAGPLQGSQTTPADYPDLPTSRLAVIVWTTPDTEMADASLRYDLARHCEAAIKEHIPSVVIIPQNVIREYQSQNSHWYESSPTALAKQFGADRLLRINVGYYKLETSGQVQFQSGKLSTNCMLYDPARPAGHEQVWSNDHLTLEYPAAGGDESSGAIPSKISKGRTMLLTRFAEQLAKAFYVQKGPKYD
ncbi:MAG: hypothetical protein BIFFINMI_01378 [Phycisphaerae bacterium]|nr:hypothetical protein [Phycisphaerae bacterium]